MMNHELQRIIASAAFIALSGLLALNSSTAFTQDRNSEHAQSALPSSIASAMLSSFDLVALGRFDIPPDAHSDRLEMLRNKEIAVPFVLDRVYKGNVNAGTTVRIYVESDMLAYPDESVSRMAKKQLLLEQARRDVAAVTEELDELERERANNRISSAAYDSRRQHLRGIQSELTSELSELFRIRRRPPFLSHGYTFYHIEGAAIRPFEYFLIAVRKINDTPLEYFVPLQSSPLLSSPFSIVWGELADDVRAELEARQ